MEHESKQPDLKKHFEAILGREIGDLSVGDILLRESIGLYSYEEEGYFSSREIVTNGSSTTACGMCKLISIGGITFTGPDGKAEFFISDYYCNRSGDFFKPEPPIIIVATAQSGRPVFVTTRTIIEPRNLKIEVFTWEPDGAPAKGQVVNWLCRFPITEGYF